MKYIIVYVKPNYFLRKKCKWWILVWWETIDYSLSYSKMANECERLKIKIIKDGN